MLFFVYFFCLISSSHFLVIKNEDAVRTGSSKWLVRGGDCRWGLEDVVVRGEGSVGMIGSWKRRCPRTVKHFY